MATSFFAAHFCVINLRRRLLFEGGIYILGKPADMNECWIRHIQASSPRGGERKGNTSPGPQNIFLEKGPHELILFYLPGLHLHAVPFSLCKLAELTPLMNWPCLLWVALPTSNTVTIVRCFQQYAQPVSPAVSCRNESYNMNSSPSTSWSLLSEITCIHESVWYV